MTASSEQHIMIVGAGLAGSLLACLLAQRGYRVDVFERRSDPRARGFLGGRSINLALSTRGLHALAKAGLSDHVLQEIIPMRGRMMHAVNGTLTFQPYSKNPSDSINSISRSGLNLLLLNAAAAHDHVTLHFDQTCVDVDFDGPAATFEHATTGAASKHTADVIIAADGAFSAVRSVMQRTDRFNYQQQFLEYGYKELSIPPTAEGEFAMDPHALHIWPRGGFMMIALPNQDRSFTCTLFWPFQGETGFDTLHDERDVRARFQRWFPDAVPLMPTLIEDFLQNPTSSLVTVRCQPWHRGRVLLIGDACHAIVPFYGQGMNAAFEDCAILDDAIERMNSDWDRILAWFSTARKPDADAIADLALQNFIEMRDLVGSRWFLWRKRGEKLLHRLLPGWYVPLYNMVTFSRIPYSQARRRARQQQRIVLGVGVALSAGLLLLLLILLITLG